MLFFLDIEIVKTSKKTKDVEKKIRDPKDRPILRAALEENVDLLITGDKDFLESGVTDPRIISTGDFLRL